MTSGLFSQFGEIKPLRNEGIYSEELKPAGYARGYTVLGGKMRIYGFANLFAFSSLTRLSFSANRRRQRFAHGIFDS